MKIRAHRKYKLLSKNK